MGFEGYRPEGELTNELLTMMRPGLTVYLKCTLLTCVVCNVLGAIYRNVLKSF